MSSRVVAALSLLGFLKAGTPLEIASTPVRAAQPDEKARSSRKAVAMPAMASWPGSGIERRAGRSRRGPGVPVNVLDDAEMPIPMMASMNA